MYKKNIGAYKQIVTKARQFKNEIRDRQIQQYKIKIRSLYQPNAVDKKNNNGNSLPPSERKRLCYCWKQISANREKFDQQLPTILNIIDQQLKPFLVLLHDFYFHPTKRIQISTLQMTTYAGLLDQLINALVEIQKYNPKFYLSCYQAQITRILSLVSKFSFSNSLWKFQQRLLFSNYWEMWLSSNLRGVQQKGRFPDIGQLSESIDYIVNILQELTKISKINSGQKKPKFTDTEEKIIELFVQIFIEHPVFKQQENTFQEYESTFFIMDRIMKAYYIYLKFFLQLLESSLITDNFLSIGYHSEDQMFCPSGGMPKMRLQTVKSVIMMGIEFYTEYWDKFLEQSHGLNINRNIIDSINRIIELSRQYVYIATYFPKQQFKIMQNRTSQKLEETSLGTFFKLSDLILWVVREQQDEKTLLAIKNKEIILCLKILMQKQVYKAQSIYDLYEESELQSYILSCIFFEQENQRQSRSQREIKYEEFREIKVKQKQKIELEMQCLKLLKELVKNGAKVDREGNLGLRYIKKVGDGSVNQFYFGELRKILGQY